MFMRTFSFLSPARWACCLLGALALMPAIATAGELDVQADNVHYDAEKQSYIAVGDVALSRDGKVLLAKHVTYNQDSGMIHALGNVQLRTDDGSILYADEMHIDDTLTREEAINFKAKTPEGIRIAANSLKKSDADARHFENFVYTPCAPCKEDPSLPPVWQVTAAKAEHNLKDKDYILRNAMLEVGGWPIFYTPYFSHPDSTVKRRTGFLQPTYGRTENLGQYIITPYFVDLGLDKNLLITPTVTEHTGPVVALDYTQAFDTGTFSAKTSYGQMKLLDAEDDQDVGHYDFTLTMRPESHIAFGGNLRHTSNPGYLETLPLSSSNFGILYDSNAYWRQYGTRNPRNRLEANIVSYRDYRSSVNVDEAPSFVPEVSAQHYSDTDSYGGRLKYNFAARHIQQKDFANTQSLSIGANYNIGQILPYGIVADYNANIEGSFFRYDSDRTGLTSGSHAQLYPRLHGSWRLPYQREFDGATGVFEPIVSFSLSPLSVNSQSLPNQDSGVLVNNETLLFSSEKISGTTRRDDSTRVGLAAEYNHYWETGTIASLLLGRNFELRAPSLSHQDIAMKRFEDRDNDYIARARLNHRNGLFLESRTTFDNGNDQRLNSHGFEASWTNMLAGFSPNLNYTFQREDTKRSLQEQEQLIAGFSQKIGDFWTFSGQTEYDLNNTEDKFRTGTLRLAYDDECLKVFGFYSRDKNKSRYAEDEQTWGMTFQLKFGH